MLHEFLTANRVELIRRCKAKVASRYPPRGTSGELDKGIPLFLEQLINTLQIQESLQAQKAKGDPSEIAKKENKPGITRAAILHGAELLKQGYTVDLVVHDYGDLCQAVTELAFEKNAPIEIEEFKTLNGCLDDAIAGAVAEFSSLRDLTSDKGVLALNERLGVFAHELRNLLQTATLAVSAIKVGTVGISGATGALLDRSLIGLRTLIDRSLADVRATAGMPMRMARIPLAHFLSEVKISSSLEAQAHECKFTVAPVDQKLAVDADRDMLSAAVGNLLQNAFKFTGPQTEVSLNVHAAADRVLIEIEDCCGGLPPGAEARMFVPFVQSGADKSGLGLGLSICRRTVEANNGVLSVRDLPGKGCVFTIDLPQSTLQ